MVVSKADGVKSIRILVCEDNPAIAAMLRTVLRTDGFEVLSAGSLVEARHALEDGSPDLLLLDLVFPDSETAGWDFLDEARRCTGSPIIVISGLGRASNRIRALRGGADDYITKPFDLEEVRARVQAVLRRGQRTDRRSESVRVDDGRKMAVVDGRAVALSPKEYLLLRLLASPPGAVCTTDDILRELWPPSEGSSATRQDVQKYVYLLRRKIEENPADPRRLLTVRGIGYRLAA